MLLKAINETEVLVINKTILFSFHENDLTDF